MPDIARLIAAVERARRYFEKTSHEYDGLSDTLAEAAAQLRADHPEGGAPLDPKNAPTCCHPSLTFGSGGFFCVDCGASWVANLPGQDNTLDYNRSQNDLTHGELRVEQAPVAPGPEAVDEALDTEHLPPEQQRVMDKALRRSCTIIDKPDFAAQAEAVEECAKLAWSEPLNERFAALSAAAATLRAMQEVVEATRILYPEIGPAANMLAAALRALEGK
jgi:hypothetical protein